MRVGEGSPASLPKPYSGNPTDSDAVGFRQRATGWIYLVRLPTRAGTQRESQLRSGAAHQRHAGRGSLKEGHNGETGLGQAVPERAEAGPAQSNGNALLAGLPENHGREMAGQVEERSTS